MSKYQSELEEYLEAGIDIAKRRIYFGNLTAGEDGGYVEWSTVERMIRGLHRMYDVGSGPIELHMSSYGGDVYSMIRLVDEIESAPVQIKFVGGGQIMSAATWIMAVCDHRTVHKNAVIMIHNGTKSESEDRHNDHLISAEDYKRLMDRMRSIYADNSRMPKEFWDAVCQRDLYLSPEEALSLGLIDEVIQPRKRGNLRKSREKALAKHPSAVSISRLVNKLYERIHHKATGKLVIDFKKEEVDLTLSDKVQETVKSTEADLPAPAKEKPEEG
jgi:ATP-dependent Clp protease, protease subunit